MRILIVLLLLVVLCFCGVGLLATLEPLDESTSRSWRWIYGGIGAASLVLMVWTLVGAGRGKDE